MHPEQYTFTADYWIWFNYKQQTQDPLQNVEVINTKQVTYTDQYHSSVNKDTLLASESGRVALLHNWMVEDYPFDRQSFRIDLEAGLDTSKMILRPLSNGFKLHKELIMPGWKLMSYHIEQRLVTYDSDFGETKLHGRSTFSRITYIVDVKRQGWGLFFKLMLGVYIAFFVAYLAFFLPSTSDQRFGLSIGGLFAAVANKYVTDSNIPASISFSFVDQVHVTTFAFILATLVLSVISLRMARSNQHQKCKRFNRNSAWIILFVYLLINIALILNANIG